VASARVLRVSLWFVLGIALIPPEPAAAQAPLTSRLSTLQNPRGIAWYRLDSPHFTIVYPDSLGDEAQRVARLLENGYQPLANSLGRTPPRIPVVLNNQSLTSNAYVAWGPRRSQWYPMPNPTVDGFGPVEWYRLLAAHEGRHVVQEHAMRTGWVGLAGRIFGDNTVAFLAASLYFPAWLWEGDAVGMETALTGAGRGRQPAFTGRNRAMLAAGMSYRYYPAWQGSYRTYYPDWYELGYILTSYVRRHHGDSAWRRVIRGAARNPLAPWALSAALRRETGASLTQVHGAAMREADSLWRAQRAAVVETPATRLSPANDEYHTWLYPQYAGDGSVIAAYTDLNTVTQLVRLRNGRREVLVPRVGLVGELQFHVRGNRVVWAEYEADPRYGERNFLVIKRLELGTGEVKRLTDRSRYFGPALSPDARRIVAVEYSLSRRARLVVLDAETGAVLERLPEDPGFLVTPAWAPDGNAIDVVRVDSVRGNALVRVALDGSPERVVIDYTAMAISRPTPVGNQVLFGSPRSGLDNIWTVDTATRAMARITSRRFGASYPSMADDGQRLVFADYGPTGYDVAEMSIDPGGIVPAQDVAPDAVLLADSVIAQERRLGALHDSAGLSPPMAGSAEVVWPVRPFTGWSRLFDFHSLMIAPTSDGMNAGLALESRNLLNTFGMNIGVVFNPNERTQALEVGASYGGLPVIVEGALRLGSRASTYTDTTGDERNFTWDEQSVTAVARLPLTRTFGLQRQSVTLSAGVGVTDISSQPVEFRFENNNGRFVPLSYVLSASQVRAAAYRDLLPTGVSATMLYRHTPGSNDYRSHIVAVRATAILPGLLANHGLVVDAGHEEQRPSNYRFSSELLFPRGFGRRYHDRLTRAGIAYHLPLWYPDLAAGPLVYARRVQGSLFAEGGRGSDRLDARVYQYRSVGGELTADLAPLGTRSTMRVGVRLSQRLTGDQRFVSEFILSLPQ
jgi:Tol biopolymer transport system component